MLSKLYGDDLKAAARLYLPPVVLFTFICWASALLSGSKNGETAVQTVYRLSEVFLFLAVLPPTICRSYATRLGSGAQMWLSMPIKAATRVVSKVLCTASLFVVSLTLAIAGRALYCFRTPAVRYPQFFPVDTGGGFSESAVDLITYALLLLAVFLCVQQLAEISMTYAMKRRRTPAKGFWLFGIMALILAVLYEVGNYGIGYLFKFLGDAAARNLYYSYSCAFFGVMTVVFVIVNSKLLKKTARL